MSLALNSTGPQHRIIVAFCLRAEPNVISFIQLGDFALGEGVKWPVLKGFQFVDLNKYSRKSSSSAALVNPHLKRLFIHETIAETAHKKREHYG